MASDKRLYIFLCNERQEMLSSIKKGLVIICSIVAVALAIATCFLLYFNASSVKYRKQYDLGTKYLSELDYDQAIVAFEKAIEIKPDNSDAYIGLADAYLGKGLTDKAIDILQKGYDKTQDSRLLDKLNELKSKEASGVAPVQNDAEDVGIGLSGTGKEFVNGILHHAYWSYDLSESSKAYLSGIISSLQAEDYHGAIDSTLSQQMVPLIKEVAVQDEENGIGEMLYSDRDELLDPNSSEIHYICRILFNDYKIYIRYDYVYMNIGDEDLSERCELYLIPLTSGMGHFFIGIRNYSCNDLTNEYGRCECSDGMYNGDALLYEEDNWDYGYGVDPEGEINLTRKGKMNNGLCEGRWVTYVDFHRGVEQIVIADYKDGRRTARSTFTDLNIDVESATLFEYTEDNFEGMADTTYYTGTDIEGGKEVYPY